MHNAGVMLQLISAVLVVVVFGLQNVDVHAAIIPNIGINYGQVANNLPAPTRVAQLIKSTAVRKLKIYDANTMMLGAFGSSGVEFAVGVKNEEISSLLDAQVALKWVSENVALYMKTSPIGVICVGNQILTNQSTVSQRTQLVMVMRNLQAALDELKLSDRVKVSAPLSMAIVTTSFPPSAGAFDPNLVKTVILPMLRFLNQTKSPFMVNLYPYYSYTSRPVDISLAYALFLPNTGVTDPYTKLHYDNLFDAQLDAVHSAIRRLGFPDIPVVVSETGWPYNGGLGASVQNAMTYNSNLVKHIQSGSGTPMKPKQVPMVYLFSLFDENLKAGPTSERYFGLFRPGDLSTVYDIGILQSSRPSYPAPPPLVPTPPSPVIARHPPPLIIPIPRPPPHIAPPLTRPPPPPLTMPPPSRPAHPPPSPRSAHHPPPPALHGPPPPDCGCSETAPPPPRPQHPPPSHPPPYPPPPVPHSPPPPPSHRVPHSPPPPHYAPPPPVRLPPPPVGGCQPMIPPPAPHPPHSSPPPPAMLYYPPPLPPSYTVPSPPSYVTPSPPPYLTPTPPATPSDPTQGHVWCVAKPGSDTVALVAALNYACGEGGADCSAIQQGGSCFSPDTVASHASYAFNSYYQKNGRNYWNCFFDGNALVTVSDPSSGSCSYPSQ